MAFWNREEGGKSLALLSKILFQRRGPHDDIANIIIFKLNLVS